MDKPHPLISVGHTHTHTHTVQGSELGVYGSVSLVAPLSTIPVHVRGGAILAMQEPNTTTTERSERERERDREGGCVGGQNLGV